MRKLAHKLFHKYIKRDDLYRLLDIYSSSQYWSPEKLTNFQFLLLKDLLEDAYDNVLYYKHIFQNASLKPKDIQNLNDFGRIPILTKDIIRDNKDSLISMSVPDKRFEANSTSGSTGENFYFYNDRKLSIHKTALEARFLEWMGIGVSDKKMTIWGALWDVKRSKQLLSSIKSWFKNSVMLSGYNLSDQDVEDYIDIMHQFKPDLIWSYPSILFHIAQFMIEKNLTYTPRAIRIGGEKLFPYQREVIEEAFHTKVFDFYGANDMRCVAQECKEHHGLHVNIESVFLEVVDEEGNPVEEGEGDLVITDLHNHVMPFIRYQIGDRARISKRMCPCGRGLPLIEEVIGRTFDLIKFPNGNRVSGTFWTLLFRSKPGFRRFQVVQTHPEKIVVRYQPAVDFHKDVLRYFTREIQANAGDDLEIEYRETSDFPLTRGGKFQFVVSEISPQ